MAPEILEGGEKSTQGDLWALGMTALVCSHSLDIVSLHGMRAGVIHT